MPARPYHHGNLRGALLDAAEDALVRGGAKSLSLRELAREIGVSHAAPRRHFEDRQALLDALAEQGFRRLGAELRDALDGVPSDVAGQLRAIGRSYFRFATGHAALLEVMYAGKHRPGADAVAQAAADAFAAPVAVVERAVRSGATRSTDVATTAVVAWAGLHGVASLATSGLLGDQDPEAVVEQMVDHLLHGMLAGAARSP